MIAAPGQTYTSPFFLLAAVLWGPKLASRKNSSASPSRAQGNALGTPDFIKEKSRYSYEVASELSISEEYHLSGRIKRTGATVSLFGRGPQIGRIRPDGKYEYFIKSYNGSTMLTVDDRGRSSYGSERAYDYLAYGTHKLLKVGSDSTDVTQKFTGKEFEKVAGLYAFGARWYDSELGMWIGVDPVGEFFNPYSYVGGDVINLVDPLGLYSWRSFRRDALSAGGTIAINAIGIGGCAVSGGQACGVGYYDHGEGTIHVIHGGKGPVSHVGEFKYNWRSNEFQARGGLGGVMGGTRVGSTYNFGRTREDGPFFTFDVMTTADFANPSSPLADGSADSELSPEEAEVISQIEREQSAPRTAFLETALDVVGAVYDGYSFLADPSWENAGYLGWSTASILLPIIPGSYVGRAARGITAPIVSSPKLQNIVKDLYKGVGRPGSVGSGTTADAIRNELRTGVATGGRFHSTKGAEYARGLEKWLQNNPNAPYHDRLVGQSLLDDLNRALSGY